MRHSLSVQARTLKENSRSFIVAVASEFHGLELHLQIQPLDPARWEKDSKNIDSVLARKAAIYAYGFAIFNGIYGFLNKIYVTHFDDGLYVLFTNCITMILILSIYCLITNNKKYLNINKVNNKKYLLLYGLFDVFYGVFNRLSLETGNVSVISVIETSSIIVTVIASRIILKEKLSWKKYAIIMIMFLCVFMLALIKT